LSSEADSHASILLFYVNEDKNSSLPLAKTTSPIMNRINTLLLPLLFSLSASASIAASKKPNIILFLADDLGYGDVGCYGATKVKTPNIDSLAREGMKFTDAHTAAALCCPSRFALMTGTAPWRPGGNVWATARSGLLFDAKQPTLGTVMKAAGYTAAAYGKWHLGLGKTKTDYTAKIAPGPLEVGFDTCLIDPSNHHGFYVKDHSVLGSRADDPLVIDGKMKVKSGAYTKMSSETNGKIFADAAAAFIAAAQKPFFLYFAPNEIHKPYKPTKAVKGTSQAGDYGDTIHDLDLLVGRVIEAVKANGAWENTIFVFSSDNGGVIDSASLKAGHRANGALQGMKADIWEGGHRVPLIVRWPGRVAAGSQCEHFVCLSDMMATFGDITGQTIDTSKSPDSLSILPLLDGKAPDAARHERAMIIVRGGSSGIVGIRHGDWMFIPGMSIHSDGMLEIYAEAGFTNDSFDASGKPLPNAPTDQLYDLASDISQTRNVIREHPEVAQRLAAQLKGIPKKKQASTGSKKDHEDE
jgi:arylsulfatase A